MNADSTSVFKPIRVMVFPISLNAMALGAAAALLFYVVTWLACAVTGHMGATGDAISAFWPGSKQLVTSGTWPGYGIEEQGPRYRHHVVVDKDSTKSEKAAARAEEDALEALLKPYIMKRVAEIRGNDDLNADQKKEALKSLTTIQSRFRWIYGIQLLSFLFLWATFGVAICRILALRIARDEICTLRSAWGYAWRVKLTALRYPVAVLLPVLFLCFCNGAAGAVASIPYLGWLLGLVLMPLVWVSSFLILLAVLVGLISIGLIPGIVAVERKGTFDAAGKATNCITARPITMVLYLTLMWVFLVYIVYGLLIEGQWIENVMGMTLTPLWNADYDFIAQGATDATLGFATAVAWGHWLLLKALRLILWGLVISLALGGFTGIFLLLRQDIDGIDPADIARDPKDAPPAAPPSEGGPPAPVEEISAPPDADASGDDAGESGEDSEKSQ